MTPEIAECPERAEPLLLAAERLYAEHGYKPVPLAVLAEDVGLHEQEVYNYVGSEEELCLACHRRARLALKPTVDEIAAEASDPSEQLLRCLVAILEFIEHHREWHDQLAERGPRERARLVAEIRESRRETIHIISQLLTEARDADGVDPGLVDTHTTAAAIFGSIRLIAAWWRTRPEIPAEQLAVAVGGLLWSGLPAALGEDEAAG